MKDLLIVAIDDEKDILDIYKTSIKSKARILVFSDPKEFVAQLKMKQIKPDIIVVDYSMPGMNGIELLQIARHLGCDFHAILISGYLDKSAAIAAANLGNTLVLEKPAPLAKISSAIDAYILEIEFKKIKASCELTYKKMRELFDMFRVFCLDELELKSTASALLVPAYKKDKAVNLDSAIYKLEDELEDLSREEKEMFKRILKLRNNLVLSELAKN